MAPGSAISRTVPRSLGIRAGGSDASLLWTTPFHRAAFFSLATSISRLIGSTIGSSLPIASYPDGAGAPSGTSIGLPFPGLSSPADSSCSPPPVAGACVGDAAFLHAVRGGEGTFAQLLPNQKPSFPFHRKTSFRQSCSLVRFLECGCLLRGWQCKKRKVQKAKLFKKRKV